MQLTFLLTALPFIIGNPIDGNNDKAKRYDYSYSWNTYPETKTNSPSKEIFTYPGHQFEIVNQSTGKTIALFKMNTNKCNSFWVKNSGIDRWSYGSDNCMFDYYDFELLTWANEIRRAKSYAKSRNVSSSKIDVKFINESGDDAVIYWLDYDGQRAQTYYFE